MKLSTFNKQLIKFIIVGIISNLVLFCVYLLLTKIGLGYKFAMSLLFIIGVIQTFTANKTWTFQHTTPIKGAYLRYFSIYALGYLINLIVLVVAVDELAFQHQWVQGVMTIFLGLFFFILQKFWVFKLS